MGLLPSLPDFLSSHSVLYPLQAGFSSGNFSASLAKASISLLLAKSQSLFSSLIILPLSSALDTTDPHPLPHHSLSSVDFHVIPLTLLLLPTSEQINEPSILFHPSPFPSLSSTASPLLYKAVLSDLHVPNHQLSYNSTIPAECLAPGTSVSYLTYSSLPCFHIQL